MCVSVCMCVCVCVQIDQFSVVHNVSNQVVGMCQKHFHLYIYITYISQALKHTVLW